MIPTKASCAGALDEWGEGWGLNGKGPTESHAEAVAHARAAATPIHGPAARPHEADLLQPISHTILRKAITSGGAGVGAGGWRRDELRALPNVVDSNTAQVLDAIECQWAWPARSHFPGKLEAAFKFYVDACGGSIEGVQRGRCNA